MPIYEYECDCGHRQEFVASMKDCCKERKCQMCSEIMYRTYNISIGDKPYDKPIVSSSLAMNPNQIEEHRQLFPDVEVTSEGQPVFTNFKQHDGYLKKTGFHKMPKKAKPKGKKIATLEK